MNINLIATIESEKQSNLSEPYIFEVVISTLDTLNTIASGSSDNMVCRIKWDQFLERQGVNHDRHDFKIVLENMGDDLLLYREDCESAFLSLVSEEHCDLFLKKVTKQKLQDPVKKLMRFKTVGSWEN